MHLPLAYFLTFRCYGTWLPGDARGSFSFGSQYGTPANEPSGRVERRVRSAMKASSLELTPVQRQCVATSLAETCAAVGWSLLAVNARSNHVHAIVASGATPERMLNALKSWATRKLRTEGHIAGGVRPWSRHGSTVYLWTERDIELAFNYVVYGQDKPRSD
jgi:REP element-mobilizing transposase RayT